MIYIVVKYFIKRKIWANQRVNKNLKKKKN